MANRDRSQYGTELRNLSKDFNSASTLAVNQPNTEGNEAPGPTQRPCWLKALFSFIGVAVATAVGVAIALTASRDSQYPEYTPLNYTLQAAYEGEDPAQGFVHYVDQPGAVWLNMTHASSTSAIIRVDTSETDATTGRRSIRIESKAQYDHGLFIFDVKHSPYGCSTWPALWLAGSNWPTQGEIDVIEAANAGVHGNQVTLHTTNGCSMHNVKRKQYGTTNSQDCYNGTNSNEGCGVRGSMDTYGPAFNDAGGGMYALELRHEGIRVWQFARSSIPRDLSILAFNPGKASPNPATWGEPLADFPSNKCNIDQHFRNQTIIANIDICGQWAGIDKFYITESNCPGTCVDYVSKQPGSVYSEAYWEFGGWWVFEGHENHIPEAANSSSLLISTPVVGEIVV